LTIGPFKFFSNALNFGKEILQIENIRHCNIVFIDEIGPLELEGAGWASPLREMLNNYKGIIVLIVRKELVRQIPHRFNFVPIHTINAVDIDLQLFLNELKKT
jgi:nucleoside-triphosphatase THEP1